jgi:hypothetical protein
MSTSVGGGGGGEAGACAWRRWFGDCGGLEKGGEEGCWLKCSGCSTLTLMAGEREGGAFKVGGEPRSRRATATGEGNAVSSDVHEAARGTERSLSVCSTKPSGGGRVRREVNSCG